MNMLSFNDLKLKKLRFVKGMGCGSGVPGAPALSEAMVAGFGSIQL